MKEGRVLGQKLSRRAFLASTAIGAAGLALACGENKLKEMVRERQTPSVKSQPETTPTQETEGPRELWRIPIQSQPLITQDAIYSVSNQKLTKFDFSSGEPLWWWQYAALPLVANQTKLAALYTPTIGQVTGERIFGFDSATGEEIWEYKTPDGFFATFPSSFLANQNPGELIYLEHETSGIVKLKKLNLSDGSPIKEKTIPEESDVYSLENQFFNLPNGKILVLGDYNWLLIDKATFNESPQNSALAGAELLSTIPAFKHPNPDIGYFSSGDSLMAVDLNTLSVLGQIERSGESTLLGVSSTHKIFEGNYWRIAGGGTLGFDETTDTLIREPERVEVYDNLLRNLKWASSEIEFPLGVKDGIAFARSKRGDSIIAVDAETGKVLWENDELYIPQYPEFVTKKDEKVYFYNADPSSQLSRGLVLDANNGNILSQSLELNPRTIVDIRYKNNTMIVTTQKSVSFLNTDNDQSVGWCCPYDERNETDEIVGIEEISENRYLLKRERSLSLIEFVI